MGNSISEKIIQTLKPEKGRYSAVLDTDQPPTQPKYRRLAKISIYIIPFWCLLLYLNYSHPIFHSSSPQRDRNIESSFLHFLIPAATQSTPYCRTIFSAGALNYPTARLINWGREFNNGNLQDGGMSVGKIDGVLDFLKKLGDRQDDELVLIADGYDTWFQLRPEVLLQRYFALVERSRQRVWPRYGLMYETSIVFSAQRHCDQEEDSWSCSAIPPSPLSDNIYGSLTDQPNDDAMNPHLYQRPRFLNPGMIIGPVGQMRFLYEHAQKKAESGNFTTDQEIFAELFGQQEYFREMIMANTGRVPEGELANDPRNGKISGEKITLDCDQCQFGINLDYLNELSVPMIYSEPHMTYMSHNRTGKLAEDIAMSTPPYWTPDYSGATDLPKEGWSSIPLITDKDTQISPVATHYPAGSNNSETWRQQWYSSHLRELVDGHAKSFRIPFAVLQTDDDTVEEYWGPNDGYGGVRLHNPKGFPGEWKQWDEICGSQEVGEEVFADGRGAYQSPVYFLYWDSKLQNKQLDTWWARKEEEAKEARRNDGPEEGL